ncbi:MAG: hypothetical protein ACFCD0_25030 [Gemmataceae bacterium]
MSDSNRYRLHLNSWHFVKRGLVGFGLSFLWVLLFEAVWLALLLSTGLFHAVLIDRQPANTTVLCFQFALSVSMMATLVGGIVGPLLLPRTLCPERAIVRSSGLGAYLGSLMGIFVGMMTGCLTGLVIGPANVERVRFVWPLMGIGALIGIIAGVVSGEKLVGSIYKRKKFEPVLPPHVQRPVTDHKRTSEAIQTLGQAEAVKTDSSTEKLTSQDTF